MDPTEKIARVIADEDGENWMHLDYYMDVARRVITAFPQLALEGREEWGALDEPRGVTVAAFSEGEARSWTAHDPDDVLVKRTVWEQPWTKVE